MSDRLGATGEFPNGKLNNKDEGEVCLAVVREGSTVIVTFGETSVRWFGMLPSQARKVANMLIQHADAIDRGC